MRILVSPDKFAGTLGAPEVAAAIAAGWHEVAPDAEVVQRPLADGGPGFLDVVRAAVPGRTLAVPTFDPLGRPVPGSILLTGDGGEREERAVASPAVASGGGTAYVESAQACGLHLLTAAERNPLITTSYGLGVLLMAAVESGVRRIVVGLGGSATNDGGAGMLAALGAAPLDVAGLALPYGGAALAACAGLGGLPRLRGVDLVAATDVDAPLTGIHGASAVFGPQKFNPGQGAVRAEVLRLDAALEVWAGVLERDLPCLLYTSDAADE